MRSEDGKMFFEDQISTCKGPEVGMGRYVSEVESSALWLWTQMPASPRRHEVVQWTPMGRPSSVTRHAALLHLVPSLQTCVWVTGNGQQR